MNFLLTANKSFEVATDKFFKEIDLDQVLVIQRHIQECRHSGSTIYFSGVGKSANIAGHISDMLKSIGFKAVALDPVLALHGDSGMVRDTDLCICFSKSGNTEELLNLVKCFNMRESRCKTISITCSPKGALRRLCDLSIVLPQNPEVDPGWNLVPTVSSQFFLHFGNLLVSGILLEEKYDLKDYSRSHPGGSIGTASRSMSDGKKIIKPAAPTIDEPKPAWVHTATLLTGKPDKVGLSWVRMNTLYKGQSDTKPKAVEEEKPEKSSDDAKAPFQLSSRRFSENTSRNNSEASLFPADDRRFLYKELMPSR